MRAWMTMLSITAPTRSPTSDMYPVFWTPSIRGTDQVYRSGNGAVLFLCSSFCFLFAVPPARADSSVLPYFSPAKGRFCPPYLCPQGRPAFPKMAACFAERSYYTRKKSIEIPLRPFILPFLTDFTMFFAKKALQMNFKNILYNYRFNFFTQIVSYRFVWGSRVCAFCTASALR